MVSLSRSAVLWANPNYVKTGAPAARPLHHPKVAGEDAVRRERVLAPACEAGHREAWGGLIAHFIGPQGNFSSAYYVSVIFSMFPHLTCRTEVAVV